jgi:ribonuclease BN (tRNA processing enzyme)
MRLTVVGCGDAFGSGGRLNTCFHVESAESRFLIDCGASSLIGLERLGLKTNALDGVFVTHLHGDHFGGLAWLLIDAQHRSKRQRPFTIAGPLGIEERFVIATEALYPGATRLATNFDLNFLEFEAETPLTANGVKVTPYEVEHPSGAPPYALRFALDGKVLSFSGDTTWTEALIGAASGADLFICDSYQYDQPNPVHLDFKTIDANFARLGAKRILLTHMGEEMLARAGDVDPDRYQAAEDGMVLTL